MTDFYPVTYEQALLQPEFPIKISKRAVKKGDFPDRVYYRHQHEELEISMVLEGSCKMECEQKIYRLNKNNIFIVNSLNAHKRILFDTEIKTLQIMVSKGLVCYDFRNLVFEQFIKSDRHIAQFLYDIYDEYEQKSLGYELRIQSLVCQMISYLLVHRTVKVLGKSIYERKSLNAEAIDKVLLYINENINKKLSIENLSKLINISPPHFCRIFKESTGYSPINYINSMRLINARSLLETTNLSVAEVARRAGFSDVNFFSKLFKRCFYLSPTQYRKTLS